LRIAPPDVQPTNRRQSARYQFYLERVEHFLYQIWIERLRQRKAKEDPTLPRIQVSTGDLAAFLESSAPKYSAAINSRASADEDSF
jgi:hypothetical protein